MKQQPALCAYYCILSVSIESTAFQFDMYSSLELVGNADAVLLIPVVIGAMQIVWLVCLLVWALGNI